MKRIFLIVGALFAISASAVSLAADAVSGGVLLNQIEKQLSSPGKDLPVPEAPKVKPEVREPAPTAVSVVVKAFRFEGVTKFSDAELQGTLSSWLDKSVDLAELNKAAELITKLYRDKGWLAEAFVPPQTIGADGVVLIKVVEAKLGAINVKSSEDARFSAERAKRYILVRNEIGADVQMSHVERSVYVLNETPGVAVSTELSPGAQEGEVQLELNLQDTPLFKGKLELANMGNRSTGLLQKIASLTLDNPSTLGDQISLNAMRTDGSNYFRSDYSMPLGYYGLRATAYYSHLSYTNSGVFAYPANPNGGTGIAESRGVGLTYPWLRSPDANLNLNLNYEQRTYSNRLVSTQAFTSAYQLNNYSVSVTGNHYDQWLGGGVLSGSLQVTQGQLQLSANNPNNYGLYTPRDYHKATFNLSRNQQVISEKYNLLIAMNGQLASVDLDSAEKFYLGGPYGVRAYPASQGGGSQGAVLSLELQRQLPYQLQASVFFDAGYIDQYKSLATYTQMLGNTNAKNNYALYGAGLGLKYIDKKAVISSSVSFPVGSNPLHNSNGLAVNADGFSSKAYFWVQGQFFF